jgi:hypothetical protein
MGENIGSTIKVHSLLVGVQRAFRALAPIADDLGVRWREPENYLDWDAVTQGTYEGFALSAIRSSAGWINFVPLIGYDRRVADYSQFSYVGVESHGTYLPFICFQTISDSFDTCLLADVEADLKVRGSLLIPFRECRFSVVGRLPTGEATIADAITWQAETN